MSKMVKELGTNIANKREIVASLGFKHKHLELAIDVGPIYVVIHKKGHKYYEETLDETGSTALAPISYDEANCLISDANTIKITY